MINNNCKMISTLDKNHLSLYVTRQLNNFFLDNEKIDINDIKKYIDISLERLEYCFKHIKRKYYIDSNGNSLFNHLNSDQYAMFLYVLSNTVWITDKNELVATKLFLLNKTLHGIDVFYSISLPKIFLFIHPIGTILGNASYSDYLVVYQGCSIGSKENLKYPIFNGPSILYSNTSIIGDCKIGKNTIFGSNSFIVDKNIDNNSIILNHFPNNKILYNKINVVEKIFQKKMNNDKN